MLRRRLWKVIFNFSSNMLKVDCWHARNKVSKGMPKKDASGRKRKPSASD